MYLNSPVAVVGTPLRAPTKGVLARDLESSRPAVPGASSEDRIYFERKEGVDRWDIFPREGDGKIREPEPNPTPTEPLWEDVWEVRFNFVFETVFVDPELFPLIVTGPTCPEAVVLGLRDREPCMRAEIKGPTAGELEKAEGDE